MARITIPMHWVKETKNTHRYEADSLQASKDAGGAKPPVDCIYLQKSALLGPLTPRKVNVEVIYE